MRTTLDLIVRDLDDELGTDVEAPSLIGGRETAEALGHHLELHIGQALERLPDHLESARRLIAHGEPIIREPSFAAAAPPFRGDDSHVQEVRGLDLEPLLPAFAHGIRRIERFRHEALVTRDEGGLEEWLNLFLARHDAARRQILGRHEPLECLPPRTIGGVDQSTLIELEQVEQEQFQGNLLLRRLDPMDAPEATHEVLKWQGLSVRVHGDDLAFQEKLGGPKGLRDRDNLGQAVRDVAQTPAKDADPVALPMDLNPSAVELVLDRRLASVLREDLVQVLGHFREHRLHRSEEAEAARPQAERALEERDLRDEAEVAEEHVGGPNGLRIDAGGVR